MTSPTDQAGAKFERLVSIMARLRGPNGCPWDREQTFDTIKPYTLEETYEVLDAIDQRDWKELAEELGDLLLQCVFYAQIAAEAGHFGIEDSLDAINEKLVRRHPHVFADALAETPDDVKKRWDEIKLEEKREKNKADGLLLDRVPRNLPALVESAQISAKAAGAGFDWSSVDEVFEKLDEEVRELHEARNDGDHKHLEHEIGDMLFVVVNIARFLKVDPEQALRKFNARFRNRFAFVEQQLAARGKRLEESDIAEMEALWGEAKQRT